LAPRAIALAHPVLQKLRALDGGVGRALEVDEETPGLAARAVVVAFLDPGQLAFLERLLAIGIELGLKGVELVLRSLSASW